MDQVIQNVEIGPTRTQLPADAFESGRSGTKLLKLLEPSVQLLRQLGREISCQRHMR